MCGSMGKLKLDLDLVCRASVYNRGRRKTRVNLGFTEHRERGPILR